MKLGASLTAVTAITNLCGALVSAPPALSWSCTVTVALPLALAAGVNVSVPFGAIDGCAENNALLLFETMKFSVWPASPGGPALIAVAQPGTVCGPASSSTV